MRFFIPCSFLLSSFVINDTSAQNGWLTGNITNYASQALYLYQCHTDILLFVDSAHTDKNGQFVFTGKNFSKIQNFEKDKGMMYKIVLQRNQWFYILNDGPESVGIEIKTVYHPDIFYNWAMDSMQVLQSEENKLFYEFQRAQKQLTVANYILKEMMRLYPLQDPFHIKIEDEYFARFNAMNDLCKEANKNFPNSLSDKIINAYYQPVNPDWQQPDNWRDSIIATHYFDYFNPADSFYLNTNILPEKIDNYFNLFSFLMRVNRETRSDYEKHIIKAADNFLKHTVSNAAVHEFCLQYILKKSDNEKMYDALFSVYDKWVYQAKVGDCEQTNPALNKWREKVSVLRNIQTGSIAPDFEIYSVESINYSTGVAQGKVNMHQLPADYTLLVFWATWCPHCTEEIPKIKKAIKLFSEKQKEKTLLPVFISLDYEEKTWNAFIEKNNLSNYTHLCEFKGWKGDIVKKYNVYATPTMFLLSQDKKIIAKPESVQQLGNALMTNSK